MSLMNIIKKGLKKTSCGCTKKNKKSKRSGKKRTYRGGYDYNRKTKRRSHRSFKSNKASHVNE